MIPKPAQLKRIGQKDNNMWDPRIEIRQGKDGEGVRERRMLTFGWTMKSSSQGVAPLMQ